MVSISLFWCHLTKCCRMRKSIVLQISFSKKTQYFVCDFCWLTPKYMSHVLSHVHSFIVHCIDCYCFNQCIWIETAFNVINSFYKLRMLKESYIRNINQQVVIERSFRFLETNNYYLHFTISVFDSKNTELWWNTLKNDYFAVKRCGTYQFASVNYN